MAERPFHFMSRRAFAKGAATIALTAGSISGVAAQSGAKPHAFPSRPVRVVFPYSAGGGPDSTLRLIAGKIEEKTGATMLIDNRPGAGGTLGSTHVAQSPADGYTLVMGSHSTHATNFLLYKNIAYNPLKDFDPVTLLFETRTYLLVPASIGVNSVKELYEYGKKRQGGLTFASPGIGSGGHLGGIMLGHAFGIPATHVPYRGSAPARTDVLAGRVDFMFNNLQQFEGDVKVGTVKVLAIAHSEREPSLPNIPTMAETGYPVEIYNWFGLFAPAGTPKPIIAKLNGMFSAAANTPELRAQLGKESVLIRTTSPEEFREFVERQIERLRKIVNDAKITL